MEIAIINTWLNSPDKDFKQGLAIYTEYGKSEVLKKILSIGPTAFNKLKLHQALIELSKTPVPEPKALVTPVVSKSRNEILTDAEYKIAPEDVRQLVAQAKELGKINAARHTELYTHINEAKRLYSVNGLLPETAIAKINTYLKERRAGYIVNYMLETDDEIDALYKKIDYWKEHKVLPENAPVTKLPFIAKDELRRQLANTRSNISKLKKKPDKQKELDEQIKRKDDLERRIREFD